MNLVLTVTEAKTTRWISLSGSPPPGRVHDSFCIDIPIYKNRYQPKTKQELLKEHFEEMEDLDWMWIEGGYIYIDTDGVRELFGAQLNDVPWVRGVLRLEPHVRAEDTEEIIFQIETNEKQVLAHTVSGGGFRLSTNAALFRRAITWICAVPVVAWSLYSYSINDLSNTAFSSSGAVLVLFGTWIEIWLWMWTEKEHNQPIGKHELWMSRLVGFIFILTGTLVWAYA